MTYGSLHTLLGIVMLSDKILFIAIALVYTSMTISNDEKMYKEAKGK